MPFNICILTYNEAINIKECLDCCPENADIYVIDSFSNDDTIQIIEKHHHKVRIIQNKWLGFGDQRNLLYQHQLRYEYTLHLDADERLSPELVMEFESITLENKNAVYKLFHKNLFEDKYLKYQRENRAGQVRFGKNGLMIFHNEGHGQSVNAKQIISINKLLPHHPMSKGVENWLIKHVGYAMKEADKDAKWVYSIPFWPEIVFLYDLFIGLGFLDGRKGFLYLQLKYGYYRNIRLLKKIIDVR